MKKIIIIYCLMLILLAVGVCAETTIFLDNFGDDSLSSNWDYRFSGNGSITTGGVLGVLNVSGGANAGTLPNGTGVRSVYYLNGTSSGSIIADFQLVELSAANQYFYFALTNHTMGSYDLTSSPPSDCGVYIKFADSTGITTGTDGGGSAFTYPSITHTISALDNDTHNAQIEALRGFDLNGKAITTYNIYYDGALEMTYIQNTTCNRSRLYAQIIEVATDNTYKEIHFDNFEFTSNETLPRINLPTGAWVGLGNDDNCLTGYAEYGHCALMPGGHPCTYSAYCLSGECYAGYCDSPGAWAGINQFIINNFGGDTTTLTFISIFIILALGVIIIIASHGHIAGIIVSGFAMMIVTIFFTIIGWLPVFILFGVILLIVIAVVFYIFMQSGG